jgi:hypothetical protein
MLRRRFIRGRRFIQVNRSFYVGAVFDDNTCSFDMTDQLSVPMNLYPPGRLYIALDTAEDNNLTGLEISVNPLAVVLAINAWSPSSIDPSTLPST